VTRAARLLAPLALLLCAGCSSLFGGGSAGMDAERVPGAITEAEQALKRDDADRAMELMSSASRSTGLPPETRDRVQGLLERSAQRRIEQLSAPDSDPDDLAELVELELPRQIAVEAGLAAARRYVAIGEPMDAYEVLKRLDTKFPMHHERVAAGDMMADIGLSLKDDTPTLFGWFDTRGEAQEVMEYVILKAPWSHRCDQCYAALSQMYEEDGEWALAIERAEGLVLNHPGSPLAPQAQARVPQLRLARLRSPEYDRSELSKARAELQEWLVGHPGHELEPTARLQLADCLRRLCVSDLTISRFYAKVDNPFGARRHALRAVEEARDAGDAEREREASEWLAGLPAVNNPVSGTGTLP
jgi:hypothetical protein